MKIYEGRRVDGLAVVEVTVQGETTPLELAPSRKVRNHSLGFEWGYAGSGPAQLALALLLHAYPERGEDWAADWHQKFKASVVQKLPHEGWRLTGAQIARAVSALEEAWRPGKFDREAETAPERRALPAHLEIPATRAVRHPALDDKTRIRIEELEARLRNATAALRLARGALLFEDEENARALDEKAVAAIDAVLGDSWVDPKEKTA